MALVYMKALHVLFMVAWFAGVFFLGRMLIYQKEAMDTKKADSIALAELGARRVWRIINLPALILTVFFGLGLAGHIGAFSQGWFHLKLALVIFFVAYNFYINTLRKKLANQEPTPSALALRIINEVPFLFLTAIIFSVYLKDIKSTLIAIGVIIVLIGMMGVSMMSAKKRRESKI